MNISFVYPGFLFALVLLAIPIIIHLFNFRRFKRVLFTNVRFLRELKQETTSQSRLKHLLVLLARLLAVAFLVAAFAQPYIPAGEGKKLAAERIVSIYIDNSFTMDAVTRDGTLLDVAKQTAREIAAAYRPSDRFHLLTNNFDPVQQRVVSRDEFLNKIDEVKTGPFSRNIDEILTRQSDVLVNNGAESKNAVLISDFQKSVTRFDNFNNDTSLSVSFIPLNADKVSNISVDSCWFSSPVVQLGEMAELNVRIRNMGGMDVNAVPVKLAVNNAQKAVAAADVPEMGYTDITLSFTTLATGWQKGVISITDDPITFDDDYYFSFYVAEKSNLLAIYSQKPSPFLNALYAPDGYFVLNNSDERQLDYSNFESNNVIFLNELPSVSSGLTSELNKYIRQGGVVVLFPDSNPDLNSYASLFNELGVAPVTAFVSNPEKVEKLMLEDEIFSGVFSGAAKINDDTDLPSVNGYFTQSGSGNASAEVLMKLRGGASFLTRYRIGKGEFYLVSSPLSGSWTNFTRHALFVPVIYRITLLSERSGKLAYFIGADDQMEIPSVALSSDKVFHLLNESKKFDIIPGHRATATGVVVSFNNAVTESGNYNLKLADVTVAAPSFNYNRLESIMSFFDADELNELFTKLHLNNFSTVNVDKLNVANNFTIISEGTPLWKYCIVLVLLFLACEILLLKFWKK